MKLTFSHAVKVLVMQWLQQQLLLLQKTMFFCICSANHTSYPDGQTPQLSLPTFLKDLVGARKNVGMGSMLECVQEKENERAMFLFYFLEKEFWKISTVGLNCLNDRQL